MEDYYTRMRDMKEKVFEALKAKDGDFTPESYCFHPRMLTYAKSLLLIIFAEGTSTEVIEGSPTTVPDALGKGLEIPLDIAYLNSAANWESVVSMGDLSAAPIIDIEAEESEDQAPLDNLRPRCSATSE